MSDRPWIGPPSYGGVYDRDPTHPDVWLLEALRRAIGRYRDAATPTAQPLDAFIPLFEALNWVASINFRIPKDEVRSPNLIGVLFARNTVHHQWADPLQFVPGAEVGILMIGVSTIGSSSRWTWRELTQLPRSRAGREGLEEYQRHLKGRDAANTLVGALRELATLLQLPAEEGARPIQAS
jgi:hypothetical protein